VHSSTELVFVYLDASGGEPTTLGRIPIPTQPSGALTSAHAADVGDGWLVVYETTSSGDTWTWMDHAVKLTRGGQLGSPTQLPSVCGGDNGPAGLVRGGSTVLLTYSCGIALLLDLAGNVLTSLTIATADTFGNPEKDTGYTVYGGQLAFNGIDYFVLYSFWTTATPSFVGKQLLGFPITPAGLVGAPITITTPTVADGMSFVAPEGLVANGSTFLALFSQVQIHASNFSYRTVTEASDHTFALSAERYLLGAPHAYEAPDDLSATALVLNDHFVVARRPHDSIGLQLIYPSSAPAIPNVTQSLASGLVWGYVPASCVAATSGTHLLLTSNSRAVRFDQALHTIDDPPIALISKSHEQFTPSFVFAGSRYLATWTEVVPNGPTATYTVDRIFAQFVSSKGETLDRASLQLSPVNESHRDALTTGNPDWSAVAWDTIGSGTLLSAAEPPVMTPFPAPSTLTNVWGIATDGKHLVAAFDNHYDIALMQLSSEATWPHAVTVAAQIADSTTTAPVVSFNAGRYAVLWTVAGDTGERVVYGARVSAELELLDDPPKELFRFISPEIQSYPGHSSSSDSGLELIASGDHWLVAWASATGSTETLRIARLSNVLDVLDPGGVQVSSQPFPPIGLVTRRVGLGWDGSYDWVVWADGEGGARSPLASLRGRRFSENLVPTDAAPFLISSDLDEMSKVTLAVGDHGRSLVGYTRYLASDFSYRVYAQLLSSTPFEDGVPCSGAGQCQSGYCVAGACSTVSGSGGGAGSGNTTGGTSGEGGTSGTVAVGGDSQVLAGANNGGDGHAGSVARGGDTAAGLAGNVASGGSAGGGTAGNIASGGVSVGGNAGNVATGGDGGTEVSGGSTASGGEGVSDAGTNDAGVGAGAVAVASAGVSSTSAGNSGGATKGHSCSVRSVGSHHTSERLVSLAGFATILCSLRRRRRFSAARESDWSRRGGNNRRPRGASRDHDRPIEPSSEAEAARF